MAQTRTYIGHGRRMFVFGSLMARQAGLEVRAELTYVAAVLHDLGLTERFAKPGRFEVNGANAARDWAAAQGLSPDETQVIWNAIALHSSMGIADAHSPEAAVVHWGAGVDVAGMGLDAIDGNDTQAVLSAIPRAADYPATFVPSSTKPPSAHLGHPLPTSEDIVLGGDPFAVHS